MFRWTDFVLLQLGDKKMCDVCGDNRFEIIEKYKKELMEATNIENSKDEMAVIDNILFRCWQMGWLDKLDAPVREVKMNDQVNHPNHYADGKIEVIDFIEDKNLGFHLGNAIKYISRAGKKDKTKTVEDLEKAIWYINRYIYCIKNDERVHNEK